MLTRLLALGGLLGLAACGSNSGDAAASTPAGSSTAARPAAATSSAAAQDVTVSAIYPYLNVKSWQGLVTADAHGTTTVGTRTTEFTYSARGDVTLVDEGTPDGPHANWPSPSAAELNDPARNVNAFKRWPVHVTYKQHTTGVGESGEKIDETCQGDETKLALVQVMMAPTGYNYMVFVEPPTVTAKCSGTSQLDISGAFVVTRVQIDDKVGPPTDPIAGTKDLSMGDIKASVTYKLTPK